MMTADGREQDAAARAGSDEAAQEAGPARALSPAAQRALAEAAERRAEQDARQADLASRGEVDGRGGLDPVRYSDWEVKGLASDF